MLASDFKTDIVVVPNQVETATKVYIYDPTINKNLTVYDFNFYVRYVGVAGYSSNAPGNIYGIITIDSDINVKVTNHQLGST